MKTTTQTARQWRGVFFDGPQSDQNRDGDEVPVWFVYVGDEEAEPVNRIYWLWSYALALDFAQRMARDRRLVASPARTSSTKPPPPNHATR